MSRKSRERREKNKTARPDDYFFNGTFEMARFGKNIIVKNDRTPAQQSAQMEYLCAEYPAQYEAISKKILAMKEKVMQCDPYGLLMHLRRVAISTQLNTFSESEFSIDANAIVRAQEYVQSILVSTANMFDPSETVDSQEDLFAQIVSDFKNLYKDVIFFYNFWAAYTEKTKGISGDRLNDIVESQYMYWVRGNRYQVFELEPLKKLLPPHDAVLQELFGVSAHDIISGLAKLQYSLSQGCADAMMMELGTEYQSFVYSTGLEAAPKDIMLSAQDCVLPIMGKVFGNDLCMNLWFI